MKFTQKTLFQCFEKSGSTPSGPSPSPCKSKQVNVLPPTFCEPSPPIHIRQWNSTTTDQSPLWKLSPIDDEYECFSSSAQKFFRICPTVDYQTVPTPVLKFIPISSSERQHELFEQYTRDHSSIDWRTIFDHLQEYRNKAIEQNQYEQLLWTEIYRPKSSKAYLGNHTRQIKRLNEWFTYWTTKLQNEQPKKIERTKRKCTFDDDDDETENSNLSCSSSMPFKPEHPRLIFVHGSGTTSLVHALAEEHNFKVTEINGTQSRARTPLLKQLEQVTSHHQLSFKRTPSDSLTSPEEKSMSSPLPAKKKLKSESNSITSYFKGKKPLLNDDEHKENLLDEQRIQLEEMPIKTRVNRNKRRNKTKVEPSPLISTENYFISSVQVEKTSLILFDEIETLTDDDQFWLCLKKVLESAKKPIILTSNSRTNPEEAIIHLSKLGYYELIHLESHSTELIECFLRLVLLTEMFEVSPDESFRKWIESFSGDLRQMLANLEFLSQSSSISNVDDQIKSKTEICSTIQWPSSLEFDAMFYSRLAERFDPSRLKTFFDPLNYEITLDYNRSHQQLKNVPDNDFQRIELYDTFKLLMQEHDNAYMIDSSSFYVDYRPYIRQICQSEQKRLAESNLNRRPRHALAFRGCSLQWSDFDVLTTGLV